MFQHHIPCLLVYFLKKHGYLDQQVQLSFPQRHLLKLSLSGFWPSGPSSRPCSEATFKVFGIAVVGGPSNTYLISGLCFLSLSYIFAKCSSHSSRISSLLITSFPSLFFMHPVAQPILFLIPLSLLLCTCH